MIRLDTLLIVRYVMEPEMEDFYIIAKKEGSYIDVSIESNYYLRLSSFHEASE